MLTQTSSSTSSTVSATTPLLDETGMIGNITIKHTVYQNESQPASNAKFVCCCIAICCATTGLLLVPTGVSMLVGALVGHYAYDEDHWVKGLLIGLGVGLAITGILAGINSCRKNEGTAQRIEI